MRVAVQLLEAADQRTAPLQARLDALQRGQTQKLTWLIVGFCAGLLCALIAAALLALVR